MDDLISRQALLDDFGLSEKTRKWGGDHSGYNTMMLYEIQDVIESQPLVKPQEPSRDMEEIAEVINCDANAETKCKMISNILIAKPHYFEKQEPTDIEQVYMKGREDGVNDFIKKSLIDE